MHRVAGHVGTFPEMRTQNAGFKGHGVTSYVDSCKWYLSVVYNATEAPALYVAEPIFHPPGYPPGYPEDRVWD